MCEREGERERTADTNADTDTDKYTHNHVDQLRYGVGLVGSLKLKSLLQNIVFLIGLF